MRKHKNPHIKNNSLMKEKKLQVGNSTREN